MSLSIHQNLEFRKFKMFFGNCEFVIWKFEKIKRRKNEESYLKCLDNLDFQDKKLYFSLRLRQDITSKWNWLENIFSTCRFEDFFRACFFDNNFLTIVAVNIYLLLWIFLALRFENGFMGGMINCFYLLNLNFLQWKCFSTYNWAAPSGASACRPFTISKPQDPISFSAANFFILIVSILFWAGGHGRW